MNLKILTIVLLFSFFKPIFLCAYEDKLLKIKFNESLAKIRVEIADSYPKRKIGLMFRKNLDRDSGMLFVYERPQKVEFWMKNTFIPLDIAFANSRGEVIHVDLNAKPLSLEIIYGGENIQYVLEVNAGMSEKLQLFKGAKLIHPRIN